MPMELSYNIDNKDDLHNAERILQNQKIYDQFGFESIFDFDEFRKESIIELMSTYSQEVVGSTHNMQVKE